MPTHVVCADSDMHIHTDARACKHTHLQQPSLCSLIMPFSLHTHWHAPDVMCVYGQVCSNVSLHNKLSAAMGAFKGTLSWL